MQRHPVIAVMYQDYHTFRRVYRVVALLHVINYESDAPGWNNGPHCSVSSGESVPICHRQYFQPFKSRNENVSCPAIERLYCYKSEYLWQCMYVSNSIYLKLKAACNLKYTLCKP